MDLWQIRIFYENQFLDFVLKILATDWGTKGAFVAGQKTIARQFEQL